VPWDGAETPFKAEEGRDIVAFRPNEFLQLDYGGPYLTEGRLPTSVASLGAFCADNLPYLLVKENL